MSAQDEDLWLGDRERRRQSADNSTRDARRTLSGSADPTGSPHAPGMAESQMIIDI